MKSKQVNFTATIEESRLIKLIVTRTVNLAAKHDVEYPKISCFMDIEACHCNGNPLNLERLLKADEFNFAHDVFGIRQHLNRITGQLENCFKPRFST